jgi:hypothetical protein
LTTRDKAVKALPLLTELSAIQAFLTDNVFAVREAMTAQLPGLIATFGGPWASKSVVPKLVQMSNEATYLSRLTSLFAFNVRGLLLACS